MKQHGIFAVFDGRDLFILTKNLGEIAAFPEAAAVSYLCDRQFCAVQQMGRLFDAVEIQIIHRGVVGQRLEYPAEIFGVHTGNPRQVLQSQALAVMALNVFQHRFDPVNPAAPILGGRGSLIGPMAVNPREQPAESCNRFQFQAWASFGEDPHQSFHSLRNLPAAAGRIEALGQTGLAVEGAQIRFYHFYGAVNAVKVEDQTFIHTVFRFSPMKHASPDQQNIPLTKGVLFVIQRDCHGSVLNPQDLPLIVPVEGHLIPGMLPVHVVILYRKFQSAVLGPVQA